VGISSSGDPYRWVGGSYEGVDQFSVGGVYVGVDQSWVGGSGEGVDQFAVGGSYVGVARLSVGGSAEGAAPASGVVGSPGVDGDPDGASGMVGSGGYRPASPAPGGRGGSVMPVTVGAPGKS
jgi:hypothetical protein